MKKWSRSPTNATSIHLGIFVSHHNQASSSLQNLKMGRLTLVCTPKSHSVCTSANRWILDTLDGAQQGKGTETQDEGVCRQNSRGVQTPRVSCDSYSFISSEVPPRAPEGPFSLICKFADGTGICKLKYPIKRPLSAPFRSSANVQMNSNLHTKSHFSLQIRRWEAVLADWTMPDHDTQQKAMSHTNAYQQK